LVIIHVFYVSTRVGTDQNLDGIQGLGGLDGSH